MDNKKIITLVTELSQIYSLSKKEVQYIVEKSIAKAYKSDVPCVIRKDGKVIIFKNGDVKCVLPGVKTLQTAFRMLNDQLRKCSFERNRISDFNNHQLIYGKISREIERGIFEVVLFDGLTQGKEISIKIFKGVFNSKYFGLKNEQYEIGRHYLFSKIKINGNEISLSRKNKNIVQRYFDDSLKKVERVLGHKVSIRVVHIEPATQSIFLRHHSKVSHLIPMIKNRIEKKCAYTVFASAENQF